MARLRANQGLQNGVAAVEFALTVPIFLALLGATVYFGLALYAKFVVLNAASTAVRNCVIKQVGFRSEGEFNGCAAAEFNTLTGNSNVGNLKTLCSNGAPVVMGTQSVPVATGALAQSVRMLTLQVGCRATIGAITWVSSGGGGGGQSNLDLKIYASMPYALNLTSIN